MILGKKLGLTPKSHRQHLSSAPTIDIYTAYLREALAAAPGLRFEFSWEDRNDVYHMMLTYNAQDNVADWKLFAGEGPLKSLILVQQTNNTVTLYNLVNSHTGKSENVSDGDGPTTSTIKKDETPTESKSGNYVLLNLQKLLSEARDDWHRPEPENGSGTGAENGSGTLAKTLEFNQIRNRADLAGWTPSNTGNEFFGQRTIPAAVELANVSPASGYIVDLTRGRGLLQSLLINDLGIMSYPAFLFLLEQEYYKSLTNGSPMTVVLLRIAGVAREDGSFHPGPLPKDAVQKTLQWLKSKLRKTDLLAQYENNAFVFLLPETELAGAKLFAKKIERFVSKPDIIPGPGNAGLKVCFGLATLGPKLKTLPVLLAGAEQALFGAMQSGQSLVTYEEYLQALSAPWEEETDLTVQPPHKGVNLDPMHQLMKQLRAEDLGIFTYAAWLVFLEREFHRAERQGRTLMTLLLRMRLNDISSDHPENMLPRPAITEAFRRIEQLQRKGDIVGHFMNGNFALLRPNASVKALDNLSKQIKNSLTEKPLAPGYDHTALRVGTQINTVCGDPKSTDVLTFQPVNRTDR
jgi:GGDEF domain-containing protein